ncbi:MAG TPA: hypothetical protein VNZ54_01000 [bacterium]|jgi:hypothetical protein|nr:hypothetical protein [bacterium]
MLRRWVPLIALALLLALALSWGRGVAVWAGGALLLAALLASMVQSLAARWKRRRTKARALALDWSVIDNSLAEPRPRRDCERQETLGICTGRECLVYDSCNFNIKRPLP